MRCSVLSQNKTKVGLKGLGVYDCFVLCHGQNKTKVGLKDIFILIATIIIFSQNKTKVGLKVIPLQIGLYDNKVCQNKTKVGLKVISEISVESFFCNVRIRLR